MSIGISGFGLAHLGMAVLLWSILQPIGRYARLTRALICSLSGLRQASTFWSMSEIMVRHHTVQKRCSPLVMWALNGVFNRRRGDYMYDYMIHGPWTMDHGQITDGIPLTKPCQQVIHALYICMFFDSNPWGKNLRPILQLSIKLRQNLVTNKHMRLPSMLS